MDWIEANIKSIMDSRIEVYATTKKELVKHYKETYPKNWNKTLSSDLSEMTGKKIDSIRRRFQPSRINNPGKGKEIEEYKQLGRKIGPIDIKPPKNGYRVIFQGDILFSDCEYREFDIDVVGVAAEELARHPERCVDIAMRAYMQQTGFSKASVGPCEDEPHLMIFPNGDNTVVRQVKEHKPAVPFFKDKSVYKKK